MRKEVKVCKIRVYGEEFFEFWKVSIGNFGGLSAKIDVWDVEDL